MKRPHSLIVRRDDRAATTPTIPLVSDEALAVLARAGGPGELAAFGELVDRYERRITAFIARRCGSHHDAEDLAQEAFFRAWSKLRTFDASRRFSVWMFTIAARIAASAWRERRRAARDVPFREPFDGEPLEPRGGARPDVWGIAERILDAETVSALWLRYAAGLEPAEIARVLGRTSVGVRVMLHRARKKIAAALVAADSGATKGAKS
jgi:RNA polymerase sigma-70 factor (ECF subfamily)